MKASEIMHTNILVGYSESDIKELVKLMLKYNVSMIPIVDDEKKAIGVVTEGDIVYRAYADVDNVDVGVGFIRKLREMLKAMAKKSGNTAQKVMTEDIIAVSKDTPLSEIAKIMVEKKIKNVPIIENDYLVGLVTRKDIMRLVLEGKL